MNTQYINRLNRINERRKEGRKEENIVCLNGSFMIQGLKIKQYTSRNTRRVKAAEFTKRKKRIIGLRTPSNTTWPEKREEDLLRRFSESRANYKARGGEYTERKFRSWRVESEIEKVKVRGRIALLPFLEPRFLCRCCTGIDSTFATATKRKWNEERN